MYYEYMCLRFWAVLRPGSRWPGRKTCVWPRIMARSAGAKRQREALRREAAAYGVAYLALQWVIPLLNEDLWCQHTAKPAR